MKLTNLTSLNESQRTYYSINFGSQNEYYSQVSAAYLKNAEDVLKDKLPPFAYEIKEGGVGHLEIIIKLNPNDFLSEIAPRKIVTLYLESPLLNSAWTSDTILSGIRNLKYHGWLNKFNVFIDEKEGSHVKKISFTVLPDLLSDFKKAIVTYVKPAKGPLLNFEKADFNLGEVYKLFLSESSLTNAELESFATRIRYLIERNCLTDILDDLIQPTTSRTVSQEELDQVIADISTDSPTSESIQAAKSMFRELLVLSQEGRPSYIDRSYELSKLSDALMRKYETPIKINDAFRSKR